MNPTPRKNDISQNPKMVAIPGLNHAFNWQKYGKSDIDTQ